MLEIFWLLPHATLFQEGQAPETSKKKKKKKRKSETRGKNGQVSDSRIRGTRYPPERKEK